MFNIRLPINFNSPYKALDIQDFWRRWHITLGRFLREYIYIPLGGSRVRESRVYLNLMVTFIICGIWHGAGWTFVFWGFLHGAALVVCRAWKKMGGRLPVFVAWLLTFIFVNMAWVFFRARSWNEALKVLSAMCGLNGVALPEEWSPCLGFLQRPPFCSSCRGRRSCRGAGMHAYGSPLAWPHVSSSRTRTRWRKALSRAGNHCSSLRPALTRPCICSR